MKILIIGAGVLGSNLARSLKKGNDVTILAINKTFETIKKNGLIIKHKFGKKIVDYFNIIDKLDENDVYEVIFIVAKISALTAQGLYPQLKSHFILGKKHGDEETKEEHGGVFGQGELNVNYAQYFVGNSYLKPLTNRQETNVFLTNVTFEPKCRNNWHIHHATSGGGQLLICVDGEEWYQEEGKEAVSLKPDYQNSFLVR